MDEELKQRVMSYMDATERVVSSEMPIVAQEYLNWEWWSSISISMIFLVGCLAAAAAIWWLVRPREPKLDFDGVFVGVFVLGVFLLAGLFITALNVERAAKVVIAPRVILLEKAADLIGGER